VVFEQKVVTAMMVHALTYVVDSNQEEDKTGHCAAEEHHAGGEQQAVAQSEVNLRTVYRDTSLCIYSFHFFSVKHKNNRQIMCTNYILTQLYHALFLNERMSSNQIKLNS